MTRTTVLHVLIVLTLSASVVAAQDSSVVTDKGIQPNRDYVSPEPFEFLDTLSGNVVLTFTDLVLPGNAGRDLRFQRTYNSQAVDANRQQWTFGLAGLPMQIREGPPVSPPASINDDLRTMWLFTPVIEMSDGSTQRTTFIDAPDASSQATIDQTMRWVLTANFWKYDRAERKLYIPDGTVAEYSLGLRLTRVVDPFGNEIALAWAAGSLVVTQQLGNGEQPRVVTFVIDDLTMLPTSMVFAGRTWSYEYDTLGTTCCKWLTRVVPPVGPAWVYEYNTSGLEAGKIARLVTPQGGEVTYTYTEQWFQIGPDPINDRESLVVLNGRSSAGRDVTAGTWGLTYGIGPVGGIGNAVLTTPSGTRVTYNYDFITNPGGTDFLAGGFSLASRIVQAPDDSELDREERQYTVLPVIEHGTTWWGTPELSSRTVTRGARTYTTALEYPAGNFGGYHLPSLITETGEQTRSTARTFVHDPSPYIVGQLTSEVVTVGAESFQKAWAYDPTTGFRNSETVHGMMTTFASDGLGNVASATKANGKTTSYGYSQGVVNSVETPEHTVTKAINLDGTVASETRGGRTTTFTYDSMSRPTSTQPPGGTNPITNVYDNATGATVTTNRGASTVTTTVDGFGKPIGTLNGVGIRTRIGYDAEGRVTYQGYPFTAADIGTTIAYDGLGRVTRRTNPGPTDSTRTYGPGSITIRDENGRDTLQTWQAFGHPDDARLTGLVDAGGKSWTYAYNALGQLRTVTAQDGITRTFVYDTRGLLTSETHPEAGTTTYQYDAAGVLTRRTDANGTVFDYVYDGNDRVRSITAGGRVTTISYEAGSDNRLSINNGTVSTTFAYDAAGRPTLRQDVVGAYVFASQYQYDDNDQVSEITYPSGRKVGYEADAEHRLTRVFETLAGRDYAFGMTYHPSGALATYTAGNTIPTTIGYDPLRYWAQSVMSGNLQLTYSQYDGVGNVGAIGDARPGMGQTFTYDSLDRLTAATGPFGSLAYAYDVHGNRQNANGSTYEYQPGTLRLTAQNGSPFTYDSNGNLKTTLTSTFGYTAENWLSTATVSGVATTYAYDADGWRARKAVPGETTYYLRGLQGELLTEWHSLGASARERDYVYAGSRLLSAVDRTSNPFPQVCGGQSVPDGSPTPVTISTSGATGNRTFEGSACRRASVKVNITSGAFGCNWSIKILHPNGTTVGTPGNVCGGTTGLLDPVLLPVSGMYTVVVDPAGTSTGTADVRVYDVVDVVGPIPLNGSTTVSLTTPGQNARLTFSGTAGQRVSVRGASASMTGSYEAGCDVWVTLLKPDGSTLSGTMTCMEGGGFMDAVTLPVAGTYTVFVNPATTALGGLTLTLYDVPADVTASITPGGSPVTVSVATPGQNARITFDGAAGQRVSLRGTNASMTGSIEAGCDVWVTLLKPDGSTLSGTMTCMEGGGFMDVVTLPTTGAYTVVVNPATTAVGSLTLTLYDVPADVTASITPGGSAATVSVTTPGQNARLTFSGVVGQRVSLRGTNATITGSIAAGCDVWVTVLKPDSTTLNGTLTCMEGGGFMDVVTLTASGVHTILVNPETVALGNLTLTLYDVPADVAGAVTIGGAAVGVTLTTPGQNGALTFTGTQGQPLTVRLTGNTIGHTTVKLLKPGGTMLTSTVSSASAFNLAMQTLPTTGVYTVVVDPTTINTGSINVAATSP